LVKGRLKFIGLIRMTGRTNHVYYHYIQTEQIVYEKNGSTNKKMGKGYKWEV
jgi:hypothetical protein